MTSPQNRWPTKPRHFEYYVFDHHIRTQLDRYLEQKRRLGYETAVLMRPFKGSGVYPVAVVRVGRGIGRLFFAPEGRWKVRSCTWGRLRRRQAPPRPGAA